MKNNRHKGFTLVELCIAMALMSVIAALSVSLISLSAKNFAVSAQRLDAAMQDADFVQRFNDAVRRSGTAFTVPKNSFTVPNLTTGWSYIGQMEHVTVPAEVSRTGKEILDTNAMVFIEYAGPGKPESVPYGSELIQNSDGWFIRTIISHDFTDANGQEHKYTLRFYKEDTDDQSATQSIGYTFTSTVSEDDEEIDNNVLSSFLQALNSIQVVYRGTEDNPPVALAFRMDFMPTVSTTVTGTQMSATVVMCIDVSGSMDASRMATMRASAQEFINELAKNPNINILLVPFSYYADCPTNFNTTITWNEQSISFPASQRKLDVTNAQQYKDDLCKTILAMKATGDTNLGDSLRVAYHKLKADSRVAGRPVFLLVMTDGENNTLTVDYGYNASCDPIHYYTGNAVYQDKSTNSGYLRINNTNANMNDGTIVANRVLPSYPYAASVVYYQMIGQLIKNDYNPTAYIINGFGVSTTNANNLRVVFPELTAFDASNLTQFNEVLTQINSDITDIMWAFDGPRM